jgi:hypothetical protein
MSIILDEARRILELSAEATPEGLRVRADMVRNKLNDSGSCARHLELAAERIETVEELLDECLEFLDRYADVVDGDYGQPMPNDAMALQTRIEMVLGRLP